MIILIIGPQGSGKSTHAQVISSRYNLRHLDVGYLIRQQAKQDSTKAEIIDHLANQKGRLLPDGIVFEYLSQEITNYHFQDLVIDGYPRTINQYQLLKKFLQEHNHHIDKVLYLAMSDEQTIQRVNQRARQDDQPQSIAARIESFHQHTDPVIEVLKQDQLLAQIDASVSFNKVHSQINKTLDPIKPPSKSFSLDAPDPESNTNQLKQDQKFPTLYALTHTESVYNRDKIFTGHIDVELSRDGVLKAKLAAEMLKDKKIDVAYRSRLIRTKQTLDPILKYHPNTQVVIDDRLIERDYGDLSGGSKVEYAKKHPDLWPIYHRSYDVPPPGGESLVMVEKRVLPALADIINRMKQEHINVIIVAHGNSLRPIRRYLEHLSSEEMMKLEHLRHQIFTYTIDDSVQPPQT